MAKTGTTVPDSEKTTIDMGLIDLGQAELLVQEGFYSNRSDFIRTAIRNQIERHAETGREIVIRKRLDLGLREITQAELRNAPDVIPELARETISALSILGSLLADQAVKAALADRIT